MIVIPDGMVMEDALTGPAFGIRLTRGKMAIVDESAYAELNMHPWHALKGRNTWYAARAARIEGRRHYIYMHRQIIDAPHTVHVDHRDRNGLNNRRVNLRLATESENGANHRRSNASKWYRGVYKRNRRWRASIGVKGTQIHLGVFDSPELAAIAYDAAAKLHFGEFAILNFPVPAGTIRHYQHNHD